MGTARSARAIERPGIGVLPQRSVDRTFVLTVGAGDVTAERLLALRDIFEANRGAARVEVTIVSDASATVLRLPALLSVMPSWELRRRITRLFAGE